jgi:hypothetical protein
MKSPNGLKNMAARNAKNPYLRLCMQVFLDAIRKIRRAAQMKPGQKGYEAAQQDLRREVAFLKHGVGGRALLCGEHVPMLFHEALNMEWLTEKSEEEIQDLVTRHRIPKSWRKEGLL